MRIRGRSGRRKGVPLGSRLRKTNFSPCLDSALTLMREGRGGGPGHLRGAIGVAKCLVRPLPLDFFEGVSEKQREQIIQNASRGNTPAEQWYRIWNVVSPGEDRPLSPYPGNYLEETVPLLHTICNDRRKHIADALQPIIDPGGFNQANLPQSSRALGARTPRDSFFATIRSIPQSEEQGRKGSLSPVVLFGPLGNMLCRSPSGAARSFYLLKVALRSLGHARPHASQNSRFRSGPYKRQTVKG